MKKKAKKGKATPSLQQKPLALKGAIMKQPTKKTIPCQAFYEKLMTFIRSLSDLQCCDLDDVLELLQNLILEEGGKDYAERWAMENLMAPKK